MSRILLLVFTVLLVPTEASAITPSSCQAAVADSFPSFLQVPIKGELARIKRQYKYDPTVGRGDFDDDGKQDAALLIERRGTQSPERAIAVCLSTRNPSAPVLIQDLYVGDQLHITSRGTKYHDYSSGKEGVYETDGISVSCCECCGATYIYRNGEFHEFVDSD